MFACRLLSAALALAALAVSAASVYAQDAAERRYALVIGNSRYADGDAALKTTAEDARAVAAELKRRGFATDAVENLGKRDLIESSERLVQQIKPGSTVVVYFNGFAIQSGRQNYLIPVDGQIWTETDVQRDGLSLNRLVGEIERQGAANTYVILEGAHRNPFERRFRTWQTGLAPVTATWQNASLIFSASPGTVLKEASGSQGTFAAELVKQIRTAGEISEEVLDRTRASVAAISNNDQVPWTYSARKTAALSQPKPAGETRPGHDAKAAEEKNAAAPVSPSGSRDQAQAPEPESKAAHASAASEERKRDQPAQASPPAPAPVPTATASGTPPGETRPVVASNQPASPPAQTGRPPNAPNAAPSPPPAVPSAGAPAQGSRPPAAAATGASGVIAAPAPTSPPLPKPVARPFSAEDQKLRDELSAKIAKNAADSVSLYTRGQLYAMHHDFPRALADFDAVLKLSANDVEALNNRCWVRAILDDVDGALADCNAALKIRPNFLDALDSRGFIMLKIGLPRRALADYEAALKINGKHASSLYGRGVARLRLGETAAGNGDLKIALALDPKVAEEFSTFGVQ